MLSNTPQPPYYAVIFSSVMKENDEGYEAMTERMIELAQKQEGFLGIESAREEVGITVSYWQSLESIKNWKNITEHLTAQKQGKLQWYKSFKVRICLVEREYGFGL